MMLVVGGCYLENCDEPHWAQLYGSGGRAAAALVRRAGSVKLVTYMTQKYRPLLEALSATYGFQIETVEAPYTTRFYYQHPLATPLITPSVASHVALPPIEVNAEAVLRFGMMEGDAKVAGAFVTYDPQSIYSPAHFAVNGSTAEHLSIVCNAAEAQSLAGVSDVRDAARRLAADAEVVVVKMGSHGALVQTKESSTSVPAYKTSSVWPIGSGDVFAAVFAYEWGEVRKNPVEAADLASRATASYCETKTLPIPLVSEIPNRSQIKPAPKTPEPPQVYLAGPFFTAAQRWLVAELRVCLYQQGLKVFSPFHDVGHGVADDVVPKDIEAIGSSSVMLAILDGLDSGTLFEVGYARALGKPVVGFVQAEGEESMKMLAGTDCLLTDDLVSSVYHTAWAAFGA